MGAPEKVSQPGDPPEKGKDDWWNPSIHEILEGVEVCLLNFGSCKLCGTEVDIMILPSSNGNIHENQLVIDFDHCTLNTNMMT